jgi:spore coat-associated protein N
VISLPPIFTATPRRLLIALGGLTIASAVAIGSGANFNATSANPGTIITSGTIVLTDSASGTAILTTGSMKPGSTSTGTVDIKNGGSVPATVTLAKAALTDTPSSPALSGKLALTVQDLGEPSCVSACPTPVTVYSGTLGSMGTIALGSYGASAAHRYKFTLSFPEGVNGADNSYEGANTKVEYVWTATQ